MYLVRSESHLAGASFDIVMWFLLFCAAVSGVGGSNLRLSSASHTKGLDEVISILLKMMSDFRGQTEADKDSFEGYSSWSDDQEADKTGYMQEQQALVLSQQALQSANEQAVQKLTAEIATLNQDIAKTMSSLTELAQLRREEHSQHEAELADLTKTIDAVNKAIEILEGHYAADGAALAEIKNRVQLAMSLVNEDDSKVKVVTQFMQQRGPDWLSVDGGKYNKYDSQSGGAGVVGTLNDLRSTLDQNKQESIEKENEQRRIYEDTKGAKEGEASRMRDEMAQKSLTKMQASSTITSCKATIAEANKNAADAKEYVALILSDRTKFKTEFDDRTRMRNDEIAATQAALDALQSVSAGAKSGVSGLFFQTHSIGFAKTTTNCARCAAEAQKLLTLSKSLKSATLMQVAGKMMQGHMAKGDFEPVKELLRTLIERLEAEQSAESSHADWCATEKDSSQKGQADREDAIKTLQTEIEFFTTNIAQLKTELDFLGDELDRVKRESRVASDDRKEAHEAFVKAKGDHDEVIGAVEKAIEALGAQYSLLQGAAKGKRIQHHQAIATKDSPFSDYQSSSGSAGSASEMLEDLLGRYSTARTQLVRDEEHATSAYKNLMATNKQFLRDTEMTFNSKMSERRGKLNRLKNAKEELKTSYTELHEISQYLQDLRPSCDDIRSTFDERKRRREAEIDALKECLEVLSDPSAMS